MISSNSQSAVRKHKVLIVEDNADTAEMLKDALSDQFEVIIALDGNAGHALAAKERPQLVLLDLGLPGMSGVEVCRALRSSDSTRHIPIIIVTGSIDNEQCEQAFLAGADDCIFKPYHTKELMARIASKIRRVEELMKQDDVLSCGNLTLNSSKLEATINGSPTKLSVLEFNLLKYLVKNKDRVLSREKILDAVWSGVEVSDRTIDTHIVSLRKRLTGCDHVITTVYGAGYVLKK